MKPVTIDSVSATIFVTYSNGVIAMRATKISYKTDKESLTEIDKDLFVGRCWAVLDDILAQPIPEPLGEPVEIDRELLTAALEYLYPIEDRGPQGSGWKSPELEALIKQMEEALE